MDEQPAIQSEPAPTPASPPDRSPAAKDAAIAKLKKAEPNVHFDTAYNMLRADPAFDPESAEDRVYLVQNWGKPVEAEKPADSPPPPGV